MTLEQMRKVYYMRSLKEKKEFEPTKEEQEMALIEAETLI